MKKSPSKLSATPVYLMANGDLRLAANQKCWPEQAKMESVLQKAVARCGHELIRAHPFNPEKKHGFIDSQKNGIEVFRTFPAAVPLIVAESVWQYSHHLLAGLFTHKGPIL